MVQLHENTPVQGHFARVSETMIYRTKATVLFTSTEACSDEVVEYRVKKMEGLTTCHQRFLHSS